VNANAFLKARHSHRGIEIRLHWVLAIAFNKNKSRVRKDHAPENFAALRHMAGKKTVHSGLHVRCLLAGWDEDCLIKVQSF
jgi:predicted transposase YbfD/YdcC